MYKLILIKPPLILHSQTSSKSKPPHIVKPPKFWYNLGFPKPPIGNLVRHILIFLISILLLSSPVIGQSINCSKEKIKKMIDLGWSDNEIKQVCGKYTKPSKPEKEKITKKRQKPKKNITSKKYSQSEKVITVKESSNPKIDSSRRPLKYSDKLGVRSNVGSLTTTHLNPPKNSNTRFYFLYGQIYNSEENRKLSSLYTLDFYKFSGKFVGIDNRLSEDNLHYVSLSVLVQRELEFSMF